MHQNVENLMYLSKHMVLTNSFERFNTEGIEVSNCLHYDI